jgi:hypothetical protein
MITLRLTGFRCPGSCCAGHSANRFKNTTEIRLVRHSSALNNQTSVIETLTDEEKEREREREREVVNCPTVMFYVLLDLMGIGNFFSFSAGLVSISRPMTNIYTTFMLYVSFAAFFPLFFSV